MPIIQDLERASQDSKMLEHFINERFPDLYDYFTWNTDEALVKDLATLKRYMTLKRTMLTSMAPSETTLAFLALLLEVAERLSFSSAFSYLSKVLRSNNYHISSRLNASARFLIGANTAEEYVGRYDDIYRMLQDALGEEDSVDNVLITIVNYYLKALTDFPFNREVVDAIRDRLNETIRADENSFLNRPLIWDILETNIADVAFASAHIHQRLDAFLKKDRTAEERANYRLIEEDTEYSELLETARSKFDEIRRISVEKYKKCGSDAVFRSLHRGVEVLTDECQLFAYMNSFGPMHHRKLLEAFEVLPIELFSQRLNIIDWGCGQAIATMILQEYCQDAGIRLEQYRALLIEPSVLAIKRGALHLRKFKPDAWISTVNRGIDGLTAPDFDFLQSRSHLHLFSNILDVHFFSLTNLIARVKERFKGHNTFVIVSPYIDDTRRARLDAFVDAFSKYANFRVISKNDNRKHEWVGSWSRVERIFEVTLP